MDRPPKRVSSVAELTDGAVLAELLEFKIERVRLEPLSGVGFSSAALHWVHITTRDGNRHRLVLKRTRLDGDWMARQSADRHGREARLLDEPRLAAIWEIYACPYVGFAIEADQVGLLLADLTPGLLPDARQSLAEDQEAALLRTIARLHARFWSRDLTSIAWLTRPGQYCDLLAPIVAADPEALAVLSPGLQDGVSRGWPSALARLSPEIRRSLECLGIDWERRWADLPPTLLHGDVKVANFALGPDGRVAAFDWALVGAGPCTVDVGWYLAVNASRLTATKDEILRRYRRLLESFLESPLADHVWSRLEETAVVAGARMLLWSKALALDAQRPGAAEEWEWWVDRLARIRLD